MATARFTIYVAPSRGRPGHPLGADETVDDGTRVGWRMLAANNREVARSAITFPDVDACVDAVVRLRRDVGEAVTVAARAGRADWSWRLRLSGSDVAVSSRTYQRRLQCESAGALFVELVPGAELVDARSPAHFAPIGRHRGGMPIVKTQYEAHRG